jgi:hypothetical protein
MDCARQQRLSRIELALKTVGGKATIRMQVTHDAQLRADKHGEQQNEERGRSGAADGGLHKAR